MLVLSRKPSETIVIDKLITVTIVRVNGKKVQVGIEAPDDVKILRGELELEIVDEWQPLEA